MRVMTVLSEPEDAAACSGVRLSMPRPKPRSAPYLTRLRTVLGWPSLQASSSGVQPSRNERKLRLRLKPLTIFLSLGRSFSQIEMMTWWLCSGIIGSCSMWLSTKPKLRESTTCTSVSSTISPLLSIGRRFVWHVLPSINTMCLPSLLMSAEKKVAFALAAGNSATRSPLRLSQTEKDLLSNECIRISEPSAEYLTKSARDDTFVITPRHSAYTAGSSALAFCSALSIPGNIVAVLVRTTPVLLPGVGVVVGRSVAQTCSTLAIVCVSSVVSAMKLHATTSPRLLHTSSALFFGWKLTCGWCTTSSLGME
eukprot:Unigene3702_Nuclearia_a/m.11300 Unigene3702_Nuclearia_a/g.11300  ORF Unigene3702_Nuclearia_a/g.11300 Unigene3702_Nuclearia_a/m.11300 type:complete len:310 (-) Unigene3702_Nuclearia_a:1801-2730(-)